jgi:thiosulfate reductase cytochrome b subunit
LTTPEWLQVIGRRQAGGGPATTSRQGFPLETLAADAADVEASAHGTDGTLSPWEWSESGTAEMNCFLCHTPNPDNAARIAALETGNFAWAATATLGSMGLATPEGEAWTYNADGFDADGNVIMAVQDPTNANCGNCHGVVHTDNQTPLTLGDLTLNEYSTLTTGQINSPQKIAQSGLNIAGKADLARSWDIHAERVLQCTDCHYALNNPVYYQDMTGAGPEHLQFDPRRIDIGEYLYRPLHQFAKGNSAQGTLAPELDNTLRRCESCHSIEATHNWLPYKERHVNAVACESCHIPEMYAPSLEYLDWTVLHEDGRPVVSYRGIEGETVNATTLITPYKPLLLPREDTDGGARLAPFNLVSSWYWVYGDPARPVPLEKLQAAWLGQEGYQPAILAAFDENGDGFLTESELVIDEGAKETAVIEALSAQGLSNPRIMADTEPYSINHDVTNGSWLSRDCRMCHSNDSRLAAPLSLSDRTPGGVEPIFVSGGPVAAAGEIIVGENGGLSFQPLTEDAGLYVLGHNASSWIDWLGVLMFLGVVLGVTVHGGLRVLSARRMAREGTQHEVEYKEVYMYDVYERFWHWLQTIVILILLFTGLVIHKPDMFGMFSFNYIVQVHNIMAAILVINAAVSLFYHLVSGEIQQFIPRPQGFFDQAIVQAKFYLNGIFKGDAHPIEKTRERKLNPLQQVTYFAILNLLLPLQIITGALMWGAQRWPSFTESIGGLAILGPLHTLVAWSFASFIVLHVYLTTTGPSPTAAIEAMMLGWDEVEVHSEAASTAD